MTRQREGLAKARAVRRILAAVLLLSFGVLAAARRPLAGDAVGPLLPDRLPPLGIKMPGDEPGEGCVVVITEPGLETVKDAAVGIIMPHVQSIDAPDVSGTVDTRVPLVRTVDYTVTHIKIRNVSVAAADVSAKVVPGAGIHVAVHRGTVLGSLSWSYRSRERLGPHDSGTAELSISELSGRMTVSIRNGGAGRPAIAVSDHGVTFGKFSVVLSGEYAWLYTIFLAVFYDRAKAAVEAAVGDALASATGEYGNAALATLPLTRPFLNGTTVLDYALVGEPAFEAGRLAAAFRAEVLTPAGGRSGLVPPALPTAAGAGGYRCPRMACLHVALPYVADTAAWALHAQGRLATVVTDADLPASFPVHLNTRSLRLFLPALDRAYPSRPVVLRLESSRPPQLFLEPAAKAGMVQSDLLLSIDVQLANGTAAEAVVFAVACAVNISPWVGGPNSTVLYARLSNPQLKLSLRRSAIGPVDADSLTNVAQTLAEMAVLPRLNQRLAEGLPLPTVAGVAFLAPEIVYVDSADYLIVTTDFEYRPNDDGAETGVLDWLGGGGGQEAAGRRTGLVDAGLVGGPLLSDDQAAAQAEAEE